MAVSKDMHRRCVEKLLQDCRKWGTDLVEVGDGGPVLDAETAKFRNRIYSISGNDTRFPHLSNEVKTCEALLPYPFLEGISRPRICKPEDLVSYSNRPFEDDRSDNEIILYNEWLAEKEKQRLKDIRRKEYCEIRSKLPELSPKSFAAYSRMKLAGTEKFWELVEKAADAGIQIEV